MQLRIIQIAIVLLAVLAAAGCGQKGPLFLPGDPSAIRPTPVPQQDTSTSDQDDDEDDDDMPPRPR